MTTPDAQGQTVGSDSISRAPVPWLGIPSIVSEVQELQKQFSVSDLCVAEVLCDAHPPQNTAFTLADADLNIENMTFQELADQSKRLATGLAEKGVTRGARVGVLMAKTRQLP